MQTSEKEVHKEPKKISYSYAFKFPIKSRDEKVLLKSPVVFKPPSLLSDSESMLVRDLADTSKLEVA